MNQSAIKTMISREFFNDPREVFVRAISNGSTKYSFLCIFNCCKESSFTDFESIIEVKEYLISGMCKKLQS
jgi:hypothetical protein